MKDSNKYWFILLILLGISLLFNNWFHGGNVGLIVTAVFFLVAILLRVFLPVQVYPLVL
jgi:membrane-bound ClpP family serine protease